MGCHRRQTGGASVQCILGGQRNMNRNMTVDGTQTSATPTELSEYMGYCWCKIKSTVPGLIIFGRSWVWFQLDRCVFFFSFSLKLTSTLFLLQNKWLHLCYLTVIVQPWTFHLAPGTVYEFQFQAETAVGEGPFSSSRPFTTSKDGMIMIVAYNYDWFSDFNMSQQ